jgi:hypothetical protein
MERSDNAETQDTDDTDGARSIPGDRFSPNSILVEKRDYNYLLAGMKSAQPAPLCQRANFLRSSAARRDIPH